MKLSMKICSKFGEEKKILRWLDEQFSNCHVWRKEYNEFKVALAEICINAIEHGNFEAEEKEIEVNVSLDGNILQALVADEGKGFEFGCRQKQEKGWGLVIVQQFVDYWTMFYDLQHDRFCFQIEKRLQGGER